MNKIYNYGMYTDKGNEKVDKKVNKLRKKGVMPIDYLDFNFFNKHFPFKKWNRKNMGEVHDTVVREVITYELQKAKGANNE